MLEGSQPRVVLIAGVGGAREHATAKALHDGGVEFAATARTLNPGIKALSVPGKYQRHDETRVKWAARWASRFSPDYVFVGSEQPLVAGVVNELDRYGIPAVGPTEAAARIEGSKLFLRELMAEHNIPGLVEYYHFTTEAEVEDFLSNNQKEYAIKPLGLTGGKGVQVMGEQLATVGDAINYAKYVLRHKDWGRGGILVEERIKGPEFTLQVFTDGKTVLPIPILFRDYKKAYEGNVGPNTGSMGDYTQEDGLLPFVSQEDNEEAFEITRRIIQAMALDGIPYKGVMYPNFMKTADGIKVVEVNCRFGDPEGINALHLLKSNLDQISRAIINEKLHEIKLVVDRKATVLKYLAPPGYPDNPCEKIPIEINEKAIRDLGADIFYAQVEPVGPGRVLTTRSRIAAVLGAGSSVREAEEVAEAALKHVKGEYHVRHDIGREELLEKDRIAYLS